MIKIKICEKHQIEKIYYEKHKKYECRQCRKDYIKEYRERNKEKIKAVTKTYNISKREKRQEWVKEDRIKNPEKYKAYGRKGQIKNAQERAIKKCVKKYGLTVEQYKKMILDCDNKCNICGKEETRKLGMDNKLTKLCVDHNHTTKKVVYEYVGIKLRK